MRNRTASTTALLSLLALPLLGACGDDNGGGITDPALRPPLMLIYPEVAAHVMRVTETAHWLEWQNWADPILEQPYQIKDSELHIPDVPGVGLAWNKTAVAAHLVDSV